VKLLLKSFTNPKILFGDQRITALLPIKNITRTNI